MSFLTRKTDATTGSAPVPPIDLAVPSHLETATFAAG